MNVIRKICKTKKKNHKTFREITAVGNSITFFFKKLLPLFCSSPFFVPLLLSRLVKTSLTLSSVHHKGQKSIKREESISCTVKKSSGFASQRGWRLLLRMRAQLCSARHFRKGRATGREDEHTNWIAGSYQPGWRLRCLGCRSSALPACSRRFHRR